MFLESLLLKVNEKNKSYDVNNSCAYLGETQYAKSGTFPIKKGWHPIGQSLHFSVKSSKLQIAAATANVVVDTPTQKRCKK